MSDLNAVFLELRKIMEPFVGQLAVIQDNDLELYLDTLHVQKNKKALFFGAVQIKKSYVSFHLMPVYLKPELLTPRSPELKKRMQGKSCFNFSTIEPDLFKELAVLSAAGYASYKAQGYVQ